MTDSYYETFASAKQLPGFWDDLAGDNIFLKRKYLGALERTNPCSQAYTIFHCPEPDSILVTYKLNLDIFTYSRLSLKLPVVIAGIPCSVSKCGYAVGKKTEAQVFEYLRDIKGAKLMLNSENAFKADSFAEGFTLPSCRMELCWDSFEDYLSDMRSHYRYRTGKALKRFSGIRQVTLDDNSLFDNRLYALYSAVYDKSEYKLEKLPIEFFREFPSMIITFYLGSEPVAFVQLVENSRELIFLFGGIDYSLNASYDIYYNMLLAIIGYGITGGFKTIDMGQTAEAVKMKLGCKPYTKYMYVNHSNGIINLLAKKGIGVLSYRQKNLSFKVFREA